MNFTKMQGCGNDYIYVDGSKENVKDKPEIARRLSDRHFGIGGDGVIFINPSETADFEMEMYNLDGSRGKMCGNGIRCVAKFVYDKGMTDKETLKIESCGSIKTLYLSVKDKKVESVRVDMGEPILKAEDIPADPTKTLGYTDDRGRLIDVPYKVGSEKYRMTAVSMGNPHAVIFLSDVKGLDLTAMGPLFEHHSAFPEAVNTEFVRVISRNELEMRVWERGSGETFACGTGASASLVAAVLNGLTDRRAALHLLGGDLDIEWKEEDNHVYMTGPAVTVFEGSVDV